MEARIRLAILSQLRDLPTLPTILSRVLDITADERSSAEDIADAIHSDHALAAKILRLINSPYYGLVHKISNIRHAVAMLGFRAIKNLILSISIHDTLIRQTRQGGLNKPVFWQHAIAAGATADRLARRIGYAEPEEAYTAGLLHDIGKIVLDRVMKEAYFKVLSSLEESGGDATETERLILGVTHCEVGGLVAERWNFPETLMAAIRSHHDPNLGEEAPGNKPGRARQLTAIVAVSDALCWLHGHGSIPTRLEPRFPPAALALIPLSSAEMDALKTDMDAELERASELFRLELPRPHPEEGAPAEEPAAATFQKLQDRVSRELENHALEISLVGAVVERIRKLDDVDEIVRAFLSDCKNRLAFDRVFYLEYDGRESLRLAYQLDRAGLRRPKKESLLPLTDENALGPIEKAAIHGQPFLANLDSPDGRDDWLQGTRELGGAPLATSESMLGVVVVDNSITKNPITEMAIQTLHLLAMEVGILIERQHLLARYRHTERLARTDELTGLANRRQAQAAVDRAIEKSRERGTPLTIVMIDLDHFKEANDRHGHEAGDRILKGVAETIQRRSRNHDTVARLGGDEFVLVLPETREEEARRVAGRVLEDVLEFAKTLEREYPGLALSLSAGLAAFDPETDDAKSLMARADQALYRAKNEGRGRVSGSEGTGTPEA